MEASVKSIHYRRASEDDLREIARLFARHNYGIQQVEWLRWKYFENPNGPALIYVAEDDEEHIIALVARLPRRFMNSKIGEFIIYENVDLFTATEFRRQKIYTKLSDFAKGERCYFLIGFPNELSHIVNELNHVIPLENWVFPILVSGTSKVWRLKRLDSIISFLLRMYAFFCLGPAPADIELCKIDEFRRDFEVDSGLNHGLRTADFLNWRFIRNPIQRYQAYEFLEGKESIGYCVYAISGSSAELYDLVCSRRRRECIRLLIEHCRSERRTHLNYRGASLCLRRFGFMRRPCSEDCIVSDLPDKQPVPEGGWYLTLADRDV